MGAEEEVKISKQCLWDPEGELDLTVLYQALSGPHVVVLSAAHAVRHITAASLTLNTMICRYSLPFTAILLLVQMLSILLDMALNRQLSSQYCLGGPNS